MIPQALGFLRTVVSIAKLSYIALSILKHGHRSRKSCFRFLSTHFSYFMFYLRRHILSNIFRLKDDAIIYAWIEFDTWNVKLFYNIIHTLHTAVIHLCRSLSFRTRRIRLSEDIFQQSQRTVYSTLDAAQLYRIIRTEPTHIIFILKVFHLPRFLFARPNWADCGGEAKWPRRLKYSRYSTKDA